MEKTNKTVGSFVTENYRTASIFDKYGIDYCCRGNRSLEEACSEVAVDKQAVLDELETLTAEKPTDDNDPAKWPLDLLADYIEKKHHRYVEKAIPELFAYLGKVVAAHGGKHPEVIEIAEHFRQSAGELTRHMKKEELMLFPFIKKMVDAQEHGKPIPKAIFGNVQNPIATMMQEHENEGERFRLIAGLSNNYGAPNDACNTYRVTYGLLKAFQDDLHRHIHLENNILFPKAIEMEAYFM